MSNPKLIAPGTTIYNRDGHEAAYTSFVEGTGHIVLPKMYDQDDPSYSWTGSPAVWDEVFTSPPSPVLNDELFELTARIENAERARREEKRLYIEQQKEIDQDIARRKRELLQHAHLANLDAYIHGQITHVVAYNDREVHVQVTVQTFKDFMEVKDGHKRYVRLLSLYGDSNGDLSWRVSRYADGSDSYANQSDVKLFTSHDAAVEYARELVQKQVKTFRDRIENGAKLNPGSTYALDGVIEGCAAFGIDPPEDLIFVRDKQRRDTYMKEVTRTRERAAIAVDTLLRHFPDSIIPE